MRRQVRHHLLVWGPSHGVFGEAERQRMSEVTDEQGLLKKEKRGEEGEEGLERRTRGHLLYHRRLLM